MGLNRERYDRWRMGRQVCRPYEMKGERTITKGHVTGKASDDNGADESPVGHPKDGSMTVATDALRLYHIQLPLFRRRYPTLESTRGDGLAMWLYALDNGYKSREEMEVLSSMTKGMRTFARRYNRAMNDPHLRALYEYELSARLDDATRLDSAKKEGRAEGIEKGLTEGRMENARATALRMRYEMGVTDEALIAKMVDAGIDDVRRWLAERPDPAQ